MWMTLSSATLCCDNALSITARYKNRFIALLLNYLADIDAFIQDKNKAIKDGLIFVLE
jgi:hypothetical protein